MFRTSQQVLVFDHLRIPYVAEPDLPASGTPDADPTTVRWVHCTVPGDDRPRTMTWPVFPSTPADGPRRSVRFRLGHLVLHGRVAGEDDVARVLRPEAGTWSRIETVRRGGRDLGAVWRSSDGSTVLPFDPDEVVRRFWSERYEDGPGPRTSGKLWSAALSAYYALRPLVPRAVQITLRRWASRFQRRRAFPRWPVEESLHDFLELVLSWTAVLAGRPVPWIAPWPAGKRWALVLTHDVETALGVDRIPVLRALDARAGHRASWNLVPERYPVADRLVRELQEDGQEVGVHGLYHDGRDLDPHEFPERLPQMRRWAQRWGAVGFRSPATHRNWDLMSTLPFDYDSSSPDSDPFEPQAGGCCSWWPFLNGGVVELPITLPQDHTLFVILGARDARLWIEKARHLRDRGGMALVITHPDYLHLGPVPESYAEFLAHFADDPEVWRALPAEVAAWWRRRAGSRVTWDGADWRVAGPAASEAAVVLALPDGAREPVTPPAAASDQSPSTVPVRLRADTAPSA